MSDLYGDIAGLKAKANAPAQSESLYGDIEGQKAKASQFTEFQGIPVQPWEYELITNHMAQAEDKEGTGWRWANALQYSRMFDKPIDDTYTNLEAYNLAFLGKSYLPKDGVRRFADSVRLGLAQFEQNNMGLKVMASGGTDGDSIQRFMELQNDINALSNDPNENIILASLEAAAQTAPYVVQSVVPGAVLALGGVALNAAAAGVEVGSVGTLTPAAAVLSAAGIATLFRVGTAIGSGAGVAGLEYMRMRGRGVDHDTASVHAAISGGIQGAIEVLLGADALLASVLTKGTAKSIAANVAKKWVIKGDVLPIAIRAAGTVGLVTAEETLEEGLQQVVSIWADYSSAEVMKQKGVQIDLPSTKENLTAIVESMKMGALAAPWFAGLPVAFKSFQDYQHMKAVRDLAQDTDRETFERTVANDPKVKEMLQNIPEDQHPEVHRKMWENEQAKVKADGKEKEGGPVPTVNGALYTKEQVISERDDGSTESILKAGDPKDGSLIGYLEYDTRNSPGGKPEIVLRSASQSAKVGDISGELIVDLMGKHPGTSIVVDEGSSAKAKELVRRMTELNPLGKEAGANWFKAGKVSANEAARVKLRNAIVKVSPQLPAPQIEALVSFAELRGNRQVQKGKYSSFAEYMDKTFLPEIASADNEELQKRFQQAKAAGQVNGRGAKGGVGFYKEGKLLSLNERLQSGVQVLVFMAPDANFDTWIEEFAHVMETQLDSEERATVEKVYGITGGWTVDNLERFQDDYRTYLRNGETSHEGLRGIFEFFTKWLRRLFAGFKGKVELNPELVRVFEGLLSSEASPLSQAEAETTEEDGLPPIEARIEGIVQKILSGSNEWSEQELQDYENNKATIEDILLKEHGATLEDGQQEGQQEPEQANPPQEPEAEAKDTRSPEEILAELDAMLAEMNQPQESDPRGPEVPTSVLDPTRFPESWMPMEDIDPDALANFKEGANAKGETKPLKGEYVELGTAPIIVLHRLADAPGKGILVTGRHRYRLRERNGHTMARVQVVNESDGYTLEWAASWDAESNIRDGQGTVRDYGNYFRHSRLTASEASSRGLLSRNEGRQGFAIGRYADDVLYSLFRSGEIKADKASAIAEAAPNNAELQALGIKKARELTAEELGNYVSILGTTLAGTEAKQLDMFGADDSLMVEAEKLAKAASDKLFSLTEERKALKGAMGLSRAERAKILEKYGVNAGDSAAMESRIEEIESEVESWKGWTTDPVKMREVRIMAGLPVKEEIAEEAIQTESDDNGGAVLFSSRFDERSLNEAAVRVFGTTVNPDEAGFILSDGAMLDFSGKNQIGKGTTASVGGGTRRLGHEAIVLLADLARKNPVTDFMTRAGAVRVDFELGAAYSIGVPSLAAAKTVAAHAQGQFTLHIDGSDGQLVGRKTIEASPAGISEFYDSPTKPETLNLWDDVELGPRKQGEQFLLFSAIEKGGPLTENELSEAFYAYGSEDEYRNALRAALIRVGAMGRGTGVGQRDINGIKNGEPATPYRDFKRVNLLGWKVTRIHELAELFMLSRNPRVELFQAIYINASGKVVAHSALTSGLINVVKVFEGDGDASIQDMKERAKRLGATEIWFGHNHPSANIEQSLEDEAVTQRLSFELGNLFGGHIITDHTRFGIFSKKEAFWQSMELGAEGENFLSSASGIKVTHPRKIAEAVMSIFSKDEPTNMMAFLNGSSTIVGWNYIGPNPDIGDIKSLVKAYGSLSSIVVTNDKTNFSRFALQIKQSRGSELDFILDAVLVDPSTGSFESAVVKGMVPPPDVGGWSRTLTNKPSFVVSYNETRQQRMLFSSSDGWVYKSEQLARSKLQGPMPGKQILAMLKSNGVKEDELHWTGLDEFLDTDEKIKPADLFAYLDANKIKMKEVVHRDKTAEEQSAQSDDEFIADRQQAKFSQHTLPGGEHYREVLFTLPQTDAQARAKFEAKNGEGWDDLTEKQKEVWRDNTASYQSSHWSEPNVVAHTRLNDRTVDGKRMLFVEEIQSDWHQDGRKKGYKNNRFYVLDAKLNEGVGLTPEEKAEYSRLWNENGEDLIPDAPFKKTWHEFVFKRIVREAVQKGYDTIGWTTGEQQADRYDLSKQISEIAYWKDGENTWGVSLLNNEGRPIDGWNPNDGLTASEIESQIGKEMAQKIVGDEGDASPADSGYFNNGKLDEGVKVIQGDGLKVGGEGMKGFYDKMLVDYANKLGKKWDARVEDADAGSTEPRYRNKATGTIGTRETWEIPWGMPLEIAGLEEAPHEPLLVHSLPVTEAMRESVQTEGLMLFSSKVDENDIETVTRSDILTKEDIDGSHTGSSVRGSSGNGGLLEEFTSQSFNLRAERLPEQRIVSIKDAQDWLEENGYERVYRRVKEKGKGSPSDRISKLQEDPRFLELPIFDRIRVAAQIERPLRNTDYTSKPSAPSANSKNNGTQRGYQPDENAKNEGSGIVSFDTTVGCDQYCFACYGLKGSAQRSVTHQHVVHRELSGKLKTGETLRLGEVGDPSKDWAWTVSQVSQFIERSRKAGSDVSYKDNVYVITKLQYLGGYDPKVIPNLQVSLDPFYPDHMRRTMKNIIALRSAHPSANISVRVRSFHSLNPELKEALDTAIEFARVFKFPVIETRMRFISTVSTELLSLDMTKYKHDGNQFKMTEPYMDREPGEFLCDENSIGCPGCKNCLKSIQYRNKLPAQTAKLKKLGINVGYVKIPADTFNPTGGSLLFSSVNDATSIVQDELEARDIDYSIRFSRSTKSRYLTFTQNGQELSVRVSDHANTNGYYPFDVSVITDDQASMDSFREWIDGIAGPKTYEGRMVFSRTGGYSSGETWDAASPLMLFSEDTDSSPSQPEPFTTNRGKFTDSLNKEDRLDKFLKALWDRMKDDYDPSKTEKGKPRQKSDVERKLLAHPFVTGAAITVGKNGKQLSPTVRRAVFGTIRKNELAYKELYADVMNDPDLAFEVRKERESIVELTDIKMPKKEKWDSMTLAEKTALFDKIRDKAVVEKIQNEGITDREIAEYIGRLQGDRAKLKEKISAIESGRERNDSLWEALKSARQESRMNAAEIKAMFRIKENKKRLLERILDPPPKAMLFLYKNQIREIQRYLKGKKWEVEKTETGAYQRTGNIIEPAGAFARFGKFLNDQKNKGLEKLLTAAMVSRINDLPVSDWTVADMKELLEIMDAIRKVGRNAYAEKQMLKRINDRAVRKAIDQSMRKLKGYNLPMATGSANERELIEKLDKKKIFDIMAMNMDHFTRYYLDRGNKDRTNWRMLVDEERRHYEKKMQAFERRVDPIIKFMKEKGYKVDQLYRKVTIGKAGPHGSDVTITVSDLLMFMLAIRNEDSRKAVIFGNLFDQSERDTWDVETLKSMATPRISAVIEALKNLSETEHSIAEMIASDYNREFDRLNEAVIDLTEEDLLKVDNYVPILRQGVVLESFGDEIIADLYARNGIVPKAGPKRGFIKKRIMIGENHQKPIKLDLWGTFIDSVDKQEHLIEFGEYHKRLNSVYAVNESSLVRETIKHTYGKNALDYIDRHIAEIGNPIQYKDKDYSESVIRSLRGNLAIGYLAYRWSSVANQLVTSPLPFLAYAPGQMVGAAGELMANPSRFIEEVEGMSVMLRNRIIDPMYEIGKHSHRDDIQGVIDKIGMIGMKGLTFADRWTVALGWKAVYNRAVMDLADPSSRLYKETLAYEQEKDPAMTAITQEQVHDLSVRHADNIVLRCQPSARGVDMSPLFRDNNEWKRIVTQFGYQLNIVYQQLRFDLPLAVAEKRYGEWIGILVAMSLAGIGMGAIKKIRGKDKDDDGIWWNDWLYYAMAQGFDSIPLAGSIVSSTAKRVVAGQKYYFAGDDIFPVVNGILGGAEGLAAGKVESVGKVIEALSLATGMPTMAIEEYFGPLFNALTGDGNAK